MEKIIRQGDVVLTVVEKAPKNIVKTGTKLIRKGEHGGRHELETLEKAQIWNVVGEDGKPTGERYIIASEPTKVVHNEHKSVNLDPGVYRIGVQREFFGNAIRQVQD